MAMFVTIDDTAAAIIGLSLLLVAVALVQPGAIESLLGMASGLLESLWGGITEVTA